MNEGEDVGVRESVVIKCNYCLQEGEEEMEHWDGVKDANDEDDGGVGDRGENSELVAPRAVGRAISPIFLTSYATSTG